MAHICNLIATTPMSLRQVCEQPNMPSRETFFKWISEDAALADQYARAKESQVEVMQDEITEIADDGRNDWMERFGKDGESLGWTLNGEHVQRSKLRIESRKWLMGKLKPKKYGDSMTHKGDPDAPLVPPAIIVPRKDLPAD